MELDLPLSVTVRYNDQVSILPMSISSNTNLRFSVGSGRPPIISSQYFDECTNVLDFPSYNARDELVLAGVRLYRLLWEILSSNVIQRGSAVWPEIDNLRKTQENIYSEQEIYNRRIE